jgi:hypothetical protein
LSAERIFDFLGQVLALYYDPITAELTHLRYCVLTSDDVQDPHARHLGQGDDILAHRRVSRCLRNPVPGHQTDILFQHEVGGRGIDPKQNTVSRALQLIGETGLEDGPSSS